MKRCVVISTLLTCLLCPWLESGRADASEGQDDDPQAQGISTCPVVISSPGNYELTADLTCGGGDGITINSSDVHLKLEGHKITADAGANSAIYVNRGGLVTLDRVRISGPGLITNSGNTFLWGVELNTVNHSQIRELTVVGSRQDGISAYNCNFLVIRSNVVGRNQQNGIFLSSVHSSDISRNDASGNGIGMQIIGSGTDNTVSHNIINGNDVGLIITSGASVHNNVTIGNRYNGIDVYGPNVEVSKNTSLANGTYGFVNADYDLFDHTADCSGNVWSDNTFFTANQSCIR